MCPVILSRRDLIPARADGGSAATFAPMLISSTKEQSWRWNIPLKEAARLASVACLDRLQSWTWALGAI